MNVAVVVDLVGEVVLVDDVLGEQLDFHPEILVAFHRGHEIEVFEVQCHEFRVWGGDHAVEEQFDGE